MVHSHVTRVPRSRGWSNHSSVSENSDSLFMFICVAQNWCLLKGAYYRVAFCEPCEWFMWLTQFSQSALWFFTLLHKPWSLLHSKARHWKSSLIRDASKPVLHLAFSYPRLPLHPGAVVNLFYLNHWVELSCSSWCWAVYESSLPSKLLWFNSQNCNHPFLKWLCEIKAPLKINGRLSYKSHLRLHCALNCHKISGSEGSALETIVWSTGQKIWFYKEI